MSDAIRVRDCTTLQEFHKCVGLQREIWGEAELEVEPSAMFVVAAHTGGQVIGAFEGEKLVGYTLAVAAIRDGTPYLHSHMTGVHAGYRGRGVGLLLKLQQRQEALSRGITRIAWTFDPLELWNAHFNFNRLGAIAREYHPNLYGVTTSPLHRGLPTDRLLAEWFLDSPRVEAAIRGNPPGLDRAAAAIELPAELKARQREGSAHVAEVQSRIRAEFSHWFGEGYAAVAVSKNELSTSYLLVPWKAAKKGSNRHQACN
jgi:predicted GNAT superfamily acetyltransferase